MDNNSTFFSQTGDPIPGVSPDTLPQLWKSLESEFQLPPVLAIEGVSYSLAMVVRVALGLTAAGGNILVVADNSIRGAVALSGLRRLANAGAGGQAIVISNGEEEKLVRDEQKRLSAIGITCTRCAASEVASQTDEVIDNFHCVIAGLESYKRAPQLEALTGTLNESHVPTHCIEVSPGLDLDSGDTSRAVFASSTLALGAPISGLTNFRDYTGRLYLCDISCPAALYARYGHDFSTLFCDQPVTQLLFEKPQ